MGEAKSKKVVIPNQAGLHARPISQFVKITSRFNSSIRVSCNGQDVDGRSVIELMTLAAGRGTELQLVSEGEDAEELLKALTALVAAGFDEQ